MAIGWQMTWAYAPYSSHAEFYRYGNDYNRMLEDIAEATDAARGVADFVIGPRYDSCLDRKSYLGAAALCGVGDDDAADAYELILQLIQ